ncbi:MalY/PatB family protein [Salininema proteolyticum]|uniref:cysteine-S-conjugate beta-lyase n=1 Tax=Salininema proteolyticum TaxID=1607685 RepID=A0ABV8TTV3_9ACTN
MESTTPPPQDNPLRRLTIDQLRRRTSVKWRIHPADVLPAWVAEMDVTLAEPVARAVNEAIALGDTGYATGDGFAEALSGFAAERWGWTGMDTARTAIVPDVMQGVAEVLKLRTEPGGPVVVNSPVYTPFYQFTANLGRKVIEAPLGADGRIDLANLESAFARASARSRRPVYLLSNPHNPTGVVHTAAELEGAATLAGEYGVRVVADEIHAPLTYAGTPFTPYLTVPGSERGVSLMSASKAWNLAGLKAGLAVAGPEAAHELGDIPEEVTHGASHLGVLAHTAAFAEGGAWLDALLAGLDENRRLLSALLAEHLPSVTWTPSEGTYLAWLDCRGTGLGEDPAAVFLERGRVAVNSGLIYGSGGEGFVRLNFATSPEILTEVVRRMASALD